MMKPIGNRIRIALDELREQITEEPHTDDCEPDDCQCMKEEVLGAIGELWTCLDEMTEART